MINISKEKVDRFLKEENMGFSDLAMILFFLSQPLLSFCVKLAGISGGRILQQIILLVAYALVIYENMILKKWKGTAIFGATLLFVSLLSGFSYIFKPELRQWLVDSNWGIFRRIFLLDSGIYAMFVLLNLKNKDRIFYNMRVIVIALLSYRLLQYGVKIKHSYWLLTANDGISELKLDYNMEFGYSMACIGMSFLALFTRFNKVYYLVPMMISFLLSIKEGSRGVLFVYVGLLFLLLLLFYTSNKKMIFNALVFVANLFLVWVAFGTIVFILVLACGGFYLYFKNQIPLLELLSSTRIMVINLSIFVLLFILISIGMNAGIITTKSRTIESLFTFKFFYANGRDKIWTSSWTEIKRTFPLGNGFFGDRPIIGETYKWGYSHNFLLEILLSFGIFGLLFILSLVYFTIKAFMKDKTNRRFRILLIISVAACSKLLVSDSFWFSLEFWSFMSLLLMSNLPHRSFNDRRESTDGKNLHVEA